MFTVYWVDWDNPAPMGVGHAWGGPGTYGVESGSLGM